MSAPATRRPEWPVQLRLPGQTAAHEGPVDMHMMYVMHHAFRRDLHDVAEAVPRTPVEDRAVWRALATRWEYLTGPLHHHHHEEDTYIWPLLEERVEERDRAVLVAMEAEHAEIDPTLEACAAGFARLAGHADTDSRAALAVRLAAVREALGRHLEHEEVEALALVQQVVAQEEWEALGKVFVKEIPVGTLVRAVPWSVHKVPAALRDVVLAHSPAAQRILWRLTRSRFERLDRRAFTYLP